MLFSNNSVNISSEDENVCYAVNGSVGNPPGGTTTIGATPNNSSGGKNVGQTTMTLVSVSLDNTVYAGRDFDIDLWPPDRQGHLTLKTSDGVIYDNDVTGPTVTFIGPYNVSTITSIWTIADGRATDSAPVLQPANYWDVGISGPEYVGVGTTNEYTAVVTVSGDGLPDPMDSTYNWTITGSTMTFADGIHTGETISVIASTNNAGESTLSVTFTPNEQGLYPKTANKIVTVYIDVDMKYPENKYSGDIISDNTIFHYTFDSAVTGVCNVSCVVVATPDTTGTQEALNNKIHWSIENVAGSTLSWVNDSGYSSNTAVYFPVSDYWKSIAQYTGLPQYNSSFGDVSASYTVNEYGYSGSGTAKIFFTGAASNHPGTNSTPNWYYYWSQTAADYGTHEYRPGARSDTHYENGAWRCFIKDDITPGVVNLHNIKNNRDYSYEYINLFAFTVRHEEQHRLDLIANWGNNDRVPSLDTDVDGLKDSIESTFINGRMYNKLLKATYDDDWDYGDGWDDAEDSALWQQTWPDDDAYDNVDWSNPGSQYGAGYTLP